MNQRFAVIALVFLFGCSFVTKWTDITGQGRSEAAADADYNACHAQAGYPERTEQGPPPKQAEVMAAAERFKACMTERGWRMDRK